ncbi:diphthine methyl ester synthase-like isoform X2 [Halichondria panicea]|uniref:diphthine methyl ester synthase-like isoform X2 n=1 Tax=Halichondria panicea TaxID=6063 RepID=UPI00312BAF8C
MLYLIGLGLHDPSDVTVKGLQIIKTASRVFLEAYTSILGVGKDELEKFYGREVMLADRDLVEQNSDEILRDAIDNDIAFLVVGDPLGATTHSDLIVRAYEMGIKFEVIHNASIMNAVSCCGLQLYRFGETVSIPFWTEGWKPDSFIDKIELNLERGLHSLCLLDIKVKEQSIKNLMKGNKIFEPPRFMSVVQASSQLLEALQNRQIKGISPKTVCVGLARIGSPSQQLVVDTLENMSKVDLGKPLHSLVIVGEVHPLEQTMLNIVCKTETK